MNGNETCQTLSKINYLKLSLGESELKYYKLVTKNYPSNFECSKYHKLEAGGKPSTWFPPGGLVELITHYDNSSVEFVST